MSIKKTITLVLKGDKPRDIDQALELAIERMKAGDSASAGTTSAGSFSFTTVEE